MTVHGWLVIDKPAGMSSTRVGNDIKKKLKTKRIGHAGTLDPFATGVLPLAIGEATKSMPYIVASVKEYIFDLTFGEQRDTDDVEGQVVATSAVMPTPGMIARIIPQFIGTISQIPPAFSAIHIDGKRAYERARAGEEVVMPIRHVHIEHLELITMLSPRTARLQVRCGTGTYVRSLGRDLAKALGSAGYLSSLQRTRVGPFLLSGAISLDNALKSEAISDISTCIKSIRSVLDDIPAVPVSMSDVDKIRKGQPIQAIATADHHDHYLLVNGQIEIAIAIMQGNYFHPIRVFNIF